MGKILLTLEVSYIRGIDSLSFGNGFKQITQTNEEGPSPGNITLPASGTEVNINLSTHIPSNKGLCLITNPSTIPVEVGFATGVRPIEVTNEIPVVFKLKSTQTQLFLESTGAATRVDIIAFAE